MGRKSETSLEDREVVVKLALEGKSLREIGKVIGRSRSTIHGIVRKFMDYGITSNKQGRGRKPILNETEKRNILLEILRDPHQSVPKLTSEIVTRIGRPVSCVTVRRVVRSVKTMGYQGITDVGDSSSAEGQNDDENPSDVLDEQTEEAGELPNKKIHHRKKKMYQNIKKQMEAYFSAANLNKDHFLGKLMMKDPNIDISIFLRLNKIRALTTDARDIVSALRNSEFLSVTEDGTKVFCTTPVIQKENTDDSTIYKAFGSMDCHLSSQVAPQDLCSIHFEEEEEEKSKAIQDEEMKGSSVEDSANPSTKKEVKLLLSGETNIEESDVGECEDDSESNQSTKMKKKKSDGYETEDICTEHETIGDGALYNKRKTEIEGKVEDTSYVQQSSIIEGQSEETKQKRSEDAEDKSNDEDLQSLRIQFGKKKHRRGKKRTEEVEENGESVSCKTSRHSKRKKCEKKSEDDETVREEEEVIEVRG